MTTHRRALALALLRQYQTGRFTYQSLADLYYLTRNAVAGMLRDARKELAADAAPLVLIAEQAR